MRGRMPGRLGLEPDVRLVRTQGQQLFIGHRARNNDRQSLHRRIQGQALRVPRELWKFIHAYDKGDPVVPIKFMVVENLDWKVPA